MAKSVGRKIFNQLAPTFEEGPRALHRIYTFAGAGTISDDFNTEIMEQRMSFIQTIYFDIPAGMSLTFSVDQTQQSITTPIGPCQGYLPILCGQEPQMLITASAAGVAVVHYMNVPMPAIIWNDAVVGIPQNVIITDGSGNSPAIQNTALPISVAAKALLDASLMYGFDGANWQRIALDANTFAINVRAVGGGGGFITTGQVAVGTGATQIVAAKLDRSKVIITMLSAVDLFIGGPAVTTGNGQLLLGAKGTSITLDTTSAIFGIGAVAGNVSFISTSLSP